MSLIVDEHRRYIADAVRIDRFRQAVRETIRPGMVVADVGSGTGILGLLALAAGAARVHSIESTGMLEVARSLAIANGFADRFHPHQSNLHDLRLPERVDVCIADFIGRFGFDAGAFDIYPYCATHLLKPGGRVVPSDFSMFVAPVERPDLAADAHFWGGSRHGFSLASVAVWGVNTSYPCSLVVPDLLGDPGLVARLPTTALPPPGGVRCELELRISRPGTLHGLGAWCSAQLSPGVEMTNSPVAPERIRRRNLFLPLAQAVDVSSGDTACVRLTILPVEALVTWSVEVVGPDGIRHPRQSHSTFRGLLLSRASLRRTNPESRPRLNPRGFARLTALQLCSEQRPLKEIEDLVWERHKNLFATRDQAAGFVSEMVSRDAAE